MKRFSGGARRGGHSDIEGQGGSSMPSQTPGIYAPRGNRDGLQPDIVQFDQFRTRTAPHVQPIGAHQWDAKKSAAWPKTRMANMSQRIRTANQPQLVIPENPDRVYFTIGNMTGAQIYLNFGSPPISGATVGIPIPNNAQFQMQGVVTSIDDIYITCATAGALITAYQGVPVGDISKLGTGALE